MAASRACRTRPRATARTTAGGCPAATRTRHHRAATPLELLFDLTFVVAFGIAADELAHCLADGHVRSGVVGFVFATFAVAWAWINYSWFASAYDTDDWVFRLATMVQMVGVIVLALGLRQAFASIEEGDVLDNGVMVAGYVVMRVPMVFLWLRAARHDPPRRRGCARVRLDDLGRAGRSGSSLAIVDLPIAHDVRDRRAADRHRAARAGRRRDAARAARPWHAAPHRRAVRAARDHHARRGDHRHGRVDQRPRRTAPQAGRSTPRVVAFAGDRRSPSRPGGRTS